MENDYRIVYQDDDLFIVDKKPGIPVTPGIQKKNLCDLVFSDFPELKKVKGFKKEEGGLLNRLDNETGGLVLFAKNDDAFIYYHSLTKEEKIKKYYLALVEGSFPEKSGVISYPIAHHPKNKAKMIAMTHSKKKSRGKPILCSTFWKILETKNNYTLLEIEITKGARHQIRVHLATEGYPILGDKLYGKSFLDLPYHCLYAYKLVFESIQKKRICLEISSQIILNQYFFFF